MKEGLAFQLRNDSKEIVAFLDKVDELLSSRSISGTVLFTVRLTLEEILTNIIKYGYDDEVDHEISVSLAEQDQVLCVTCVDDGHEFNPLEAEAPDLNAPASDRKVGGLGLHLVKNMVDSIEYSRKNNQNVLLFRISLTPPDSA